TPVNQQFDFNWAFSYVVAGFSPRSILPRTRAKARDYILECNILSRSRGLCASGSSLDQLTDFIVGGLIEPPIPVTDSPERLGGHGTYNFICEFTQAVACLLWCGRYCNNQLFWLP